MPFAADFPVGIAGGREKSAAFWPEAEIPALLRKGSLGASGGQSDFARNFLALDEMGVDVPLKINGLGRYVLRAASLA